MFGLEWRILQSECSLFLCTAWHLQTSFEETLLCGMLCLETDMISKVKFVVPSCNMTLFEEVIWFALN